MVRPLADISDSDLAAEMLARMARSSQSDWIDAYAAGEIVTSGEAAYICATSPDTILRRIDASVDIGSPIAVKFADVWLISKRRLLADHAHHEGHDEAEAAAERARALRSWPQKVRLRPHAESAGRGKAEP